MEILVKEKLWKALGFFLLSLLSCLKVMKTFWKTYGAEWILRHVRNIMVEGIAGDEGMAV